MTAEQPRPSDSRTVGNRRRTSTETLLAAVVALVVASLLGSGSLLQLAHRQPVGRWRDPIVETAEAVDRAANALALNRADDLARRTLDRKLVDAVDVDLLVASYHLAPGFVPVSPSGPVRRRVTARAPLKIWIVGDSMSNDLALGLARVVSPETQTAFIAGGEVSSGLTRDDVIDWPSLIASRVAGVRPDVIIAVFGSNDFQDIATNDGFAAEGSPAWVVEYRRRVAGTMDLLEGRGDVLWIGLPPVRGGTLASGIRPMNEIYRTEAVLRPWVTFVPTTSLFASSDGGFARMISVNGADVEVRKDDGVHWTIAGAELIGAQVRDLVGANWGVDLGP